MALQDGITERAVQRILVGLVQAPVARVDKEERRNRYIIDLDQQLRHPSESHKTIGEFIKLIKSEYMVDQ